MPDADARPGPSARQGPVVVTSTTALGPAIGAPDAAGAIWRLTGEHRGLDSNVVQLPPGGAIDSHVGPDLDVLWHVVVGSGVLLTDAGETGLRPGDVVHLPRRTVRGVRAGGEGLRYLTVHARKPGLTLGPTR